MPLPAPRGELNLDKLVVTPPGAQRRFFRSRSDRSKARYDYIRDLTQLRTRAGSLSEQDIQEIDAWMERGPQAKTAPRSMGAG